MMTYELQRLERFPHGMGNTAPTYKEALTYAMQDLAADPLGRFVGYGLLNGKGANGTMKPVPNDKIVETTVAEGLMAGVAHGLALTGLRPLLFVERADFLWLAMSAIANHLDCAREISRDQFNPCVVIRVVVGNQNKPLFTGRTHTQNLAPACRAMLRMPVYELRTPEEVAGGYERAFMEQREGIGSSMLFEFRDLY